MFFFFSSLGKHKMKRLLVFPKINQMLLSENKTKKDEYSNTASPWQRHNLTCPGRTDLASRRATCAKLDDPRAGARRGCEQYDKTTSMGNIKRPQPLFPLPVWFWWQSLLFPLLYLNSAAAVDFRGRFSLSLDTSEATNKCLPAARWNRMTN